MSDFIKTALIGHPVSQSKSPLIHGHWMKAHGIDGRYDAIDIPEENLADGIQKIIDEGYRGFNVTVPYKQGIFELCDEVDATAKVIGAVNTVIIEDGKLYGINTDAYGFMQNITQTTGLPNFEKGPCVILGAGGAARAVVYALAEAGAKEIIIANRTFEKAREICTIDDKIMRPVEWSQRKDVLLNASLLVNTTSSGMVTKDKLEIDISLLPTNSIVSDIVYVPLMTDLLIEAKERGNPIVTGIGMLLHQARLAFEKWHSVLPQVDDELEKVVLS